MSLQNTDQFIVHREGIDYQLAYEKLKADVLAGVEIPEAVSPGDGKLTIKDSAGNELGSFTANQAAAADITLPAGFSGDYNDLINKPEIPEIPEAVAPGDGKLTISNADGSEAGVFTANQAGDVTITLPAGFSGDYNDLENKPEIPEIPEIPEAAKNGTITFRDGRGREFGQFSANQEEDQELLVFTDAAHFDQDPPRVPCCLHIKHVRNGKIKIQMDYDTPVQSVEVIGMGNHINLSNFGRETKRWMSTLMIFGNEPKYDRDGRASKNNLVLEYGDFSRPAAGDEHDWNGDNGEAIELLEAAGFTTDNFCGTTVEGDRFDGSGDCYLSIHSHALAHQHENEWGDEEKWVEVPNNLEYLVYFWPDFKGRNKSFISVEDGATYELGPLTNTTLRKNWSWFFAGSSNAGAPIAGLRYLDVSNGTDFSRMFYRQKTMGEVPDLRFFNVGKGENFEAMFEDCPEFDADLSRWDMGNARNMQQMFRQCHNFTCGRRETAEHGIGRWNPVNLGNDDRDDQRAAWDMFEQCYELSVDMRNWKCPHVLDLGDCVRNQTGSRMQNYVFWRGSSQLNSSRDWPWLTVCKNYNDHAYLAANNFIQWPSCGPDRYKKNQYDSDTSTIVKVGYTQHFYDARKAIWQEYADWIDNAVKEGLLPSWDYRTMGSVEEREVEYDRCKEKDDLLVEEHFAPDWGQIFIRNLTSKSKDDYVINEGNNLEDIPAEVWCKPGNYFQIRPMWDKEYLEGEFVNPNNNYKKEWAPRKTDFKWTVLEGNVTMDDDEVWKPKFTCNGELGDVLKVQLQVIHADWEVTDENDEPVEPPSDTQIMLITLAESKPEPAPEA